MYDGGGCRLAEQLYQALLAGHVGRVEALLAQGCRHDSMMPDGRTPLFHAAMLEAPDCLLALIEGGVDVRARDTSGASALHRAFHAGPVEALLRLGLDPNSRDRCGAVPLHHPRTAEAAALLVRAGGDLQVTNFAWRTPVQAMRAASDQARAEGDARLAATLDRTVRCLERFEASGVDRPQRRRRPIARLMETGSRRG